jgi:hypothetical protein
MNRSTLVAGLMIVMMALCGTFAAPTYAASEAAVGTDARVDEQYVFSVGVVDRVSVNSLTLRFADGATETYTLNGSTTVQSQNGDTLNVADLEMGEMVIVLSLENDPLARTIVSGGDAGFHEATPADIRGHDQRECTECDAHAP